MIVTNELSKICDDEKDYIDNIKSDLAKFNDTITEDTEKKLRDGFFSKALIDLRMFRHNNGLNAVSGEKL